MTQSEQCKTMLTNNAWLASNWKENGWGRATRQQTILTGSGCEPTVITFILVSLHLHTASNCRTFTGIK